MGSACRRLRDQDLKPIAEERDDLARPQSGSVDRPESVPHERPARLTKEGGNLWSGSPHRKDLQGYAPLRAYFTRLCPRSFGHLGECDSVRSVGPYLRRLLLSVDPPAAAKAEGDAPDARGPETRRQGRHWGRHLGDCAACADIAEQRWEADRS
jgi:hypothetical protein